MDESFFKTNTFKKLSPRTQKRYKSNFKRLKTKSDFEERTAITADYLKAFDKNQKDEDVSKQKSFRNVNMYMKQNIIRK